jgi:hypothetical protein
MNKLFSLVPVFVVIVLAGIAASFGAAAQERDVGPKCVQWNSHRVLFKKGDGTQGVKPEMVLALSHWVDDGAADTNTARSAILYTLPKQGISCRQYEKRNPLQVDLFFYSQSYIISPQVKGDLEKFASSIRDSRCNVELTALAAKEFTGADAAKTNKELAKQRVKAMVDIFTAAGIDSDRLVDTSVEYVGDKKPNVASSRLATASLM